MLANVWPALPAFLLCILEHINILGDPLYFEVISLHFIIQRQEVERMATCAPRLEVDEQSLWYNASVKSLRVSEFLHSCVFDGGEDELCSFLPRRLVGAAVGSPVFVRYLRERTDNGRGIVIDRHVVSANSCGFDEFRAVARCVLCHRPNEANEIVCASSFVVRDL